LCAGVEIADAGGDALGHVDLKKKKAPAGAPKNDVRQPTPTARSDPSAASRTNARPCRRQPS
jgi:hypothetical protein